MIVLPRPHDLPGTDPRFHEARKYLSPVKYKGREILASHGACKETGCNYSSAWTSNKARDRGMWQHRALRVREARMLYFHEKFQGDQRKVGETFQQTADKHTHEFNSWMGLVGSFIDDFADVALEDLPDYRFRVEYDLGNSAYDVAKAALDNAYTF